MEICIDVDTAVTVPVNIFPLTDDTDFKSRETGIVYNESGMDLVWNFVTSAGVMTQTVVTPTTAGVYDWSHAGDGMYKIEMPASGGGSINNDTEGYGWFTGVCDGVLPWRGPIICFRASGLNDLLVDSPFSATRGLAGTNIDNLDAAITSLNNLSALANLYGSPLLEIPDSSSTTFAYTLVVRDNEGKLKNLDGSPTITAANAAGSDRSANLSSVTNPSTGRYIFTYSVSSAATAESLRITCSGTISAEARYVEWIGAVVDYNAATMIAAIKAKTDNLPASPAAVGSAMTLTSGERDSIAAALLDLANGVETGKTPRQVFRLIAAVLCGRRTHVGETTEQYDAVGNTGTARVVANLDSDGIGTPTLTP